ncbi:MAG TPA: 50S ribosomal protein L24 [Candidatus Dependentiae bacterium]|nr:50S ribosomal protein L24 [Candidatus Dependentiae bacterium]HRQ62309.1 50S ribosomal protein L24 [Candidatus Dependentiae bacterium]
MVARVKKNDYVKVLTGKDKGKEGQVITITPKKDMILVKDVAVATKHVKARRQGETGSIRKEETFVHLSNVMPVCSNCKKACRVTSKILDSGKRARACGRCKEIF